MKILFINDKSSSVPEYLLKWFINQTGFFFEDNDELIGSCSFLLLYGKPDLLRKLKNIKEYQDTPKPVIFIPVIDYTTINFIEDKPDILYTEQDISIPVWGTKNPGKDFEPFLPQSFAFDFSPATHVNSSEQQIYFSFDPFSNAYYHLQRVEEKERGKTDDLFNSQSSILNKYLQIPIVDYFIDILKKVIIESANEFSTPLLLKERWPNGKKFAFSISHNVDLTRKWGPRRIIKNLVCHGFHLRLNKIFSMFIEVLFKKNSYWTFPRLIELYKNHQWESTFFFLAKCFQGPNYHYNISIKKFKKLFLKLKQHNHEIGLHSSLNSFGNNSRVKKEIHKLKYFSNTGIYGIRQHHLKLKFPEAFNFFSGLHFDYDSSMAYCDSPGFRSATSLPYPAYKSPEKALFEIPFAFYDYHLEKNTDWEQYVKKTIETVKNTEGFFHILWHPNNLAEPSFSEMFFQIVKLLFENSNESHNFSLGQLLEWIKSRDSIKLKINYQNQEISHITFYSNLDIKHLGLKIIGAKAEIISEFENGDTIKHDSLSSELTMYTSPKFSPSAFS